MASLRTELGLSPDQFYRRVRILTDGELISPERGQKNKLLLASPDESVLRQFRAIEQNNQERSLEWCLEHLRYELERARRETAESSLEFSKHEVRQLRNALVRVRRNPLRRAWGWLRRRVARTPAPAE